MLTLQPPSTPGGRRTLKSSPGTMLPPPSPEMLTLPRTGAPRARGIKAGGLAGSGSTVRL